MAVRNLKRKNGDKAVEAVTSVGGADGPTVIFWGGKQKATIKQTLQKAVYRYRRNKLLQSIKANPHTMKQVIEYAKTKWGYVEISSESEEYKTEYIQLRASFVMQYKPELLGDLAELPKLKEHTQESVTLLFQQIEERQRAVEEIPAELFDIKLHILEKEQEECSSKIILEEHYGYIGGSASGNKKQMKEFHKVFREVYRYYGVSQSDIENQTKRYEELVKTLARK